MKKISKIIKKNLRRYRKSSSFRARFAYTKYYEKLKINNNEVLIQSYDGSSISGNPYYLLKELCFNEKYNNLKKYVVANKEEYKNIKHFLKKKNFRDIHLVKLHSKKYCKLLARAKYLINNSTFAPYFIKKEGQIYVNTWHGTPLKNMGKKIGNAPNELGNTQRNFMMADYLLYPNEFTFECMKEDYMLDNIFKGKYLISGYPRNSVFCDSERKSNIREELNLNDKKIAVYMPTWRGSLVDKNNEEQFICVLHILYQIDKRLNDDTVLYVKLHNYNNSKIDYDRFKHIVPFPKDYEPYEFLNEADCLITDYSSVFFDYANTGKKIILFAYDKKEYLSDRGLYLDYDSFPFNYVENIDDLVDEIHNCDEYVRYDDFCEKFTKHDNKDVPANVCNLVFNDEKNSIEVINGTKYANDNPNIYIFGGALSKNGITTALKGIINNVDIKKYNFYLTFYKGKVEKNKMVINDLNRIPYIPIQGNKNMNYKEAICHFMFFKLNLRPKFITKVVDNIFKREIKRLYPTIKFDYAIHYTGYEKSIIHVIKNMDAKKIIYIHNDMKKEKQTKGNFDYKSMTLALDNFDKIVCIRDTSRNEIIDFHPTIERKKVVVAHNLNNIEGIRERAEEQIKFDADTYCNISLEQLKEIMLDKEKEKLINIGRFSPEKGHRRLIDAFIKYRKKNINSYLIIIGGYGKSFDEINNYIIDNEIENVIIIKSISNPYPILGNSNLFVLSSFYEGLPMTIMEALILDKPVLSTDIPGPSEFLKKGYGYLVKDSEQGLYDGLCDFSKGKLSNLKKFDAEQFNDTALEEFYNLFK